MKPLLVAVAVLVAWTSIAQAQQYNNRARALMGLPPLPMAPIQLSPEVIRRLQRPQPDMQPAKPANIF